LFWITLAGDQIKVLVALGFCPQNQEHYSNLNYIGTGTGIGSGTYAVVKDCVKRMQQMANMFSPQTLQFCQLNIHIHQVEIAGRQQTFQLLPKKKSNKISVPVLSTQKTIGAALYGGAGAISRRSSSSVPVRCRYLMFNKDFFNAFFIYYPHLQHE
jgi:hypothetical protein